jgi:hypothetical protein
MTPDIDQRYPAFRERNMTDVVLRLQCGACGAFTEITRAEEIEYLSRLDTKYPCQYVTINCKCGDFQFVLQAHEPHTGKR